MKFEDANGTWAFTVVWRIENFTHCLQRKGEILYSPVFPVAPLDNTKWVLCLFPRGRHTGLMESFGLYLKREPTGPASVVVEYEISIFTSDHTLVAALEFSDCFPFVGDARGKFHGIPKLNARSCIFENIFLSQEILTVRCRMREFKVDPVSCVESVALSRIGVDRGQFDWTIENFSKLVLDDTRSTRLVTASVLREPFLLKASLQGTPREDSLFCIRIVQHEAKHRRMLICFKLSILDISGRVAKVVEDKHWFERSGREVWVVSKSIARREILQNDYLLGDVLSLRCEFSVSVGVECAKFENKLEKLEDELEDPEVALVSVLRRPSNYKTVINALQEDLKSLYDEKILSDFELRTEDTSFKVHKVILSARSPVFKAMFTHSMTEKSSDWLHIPDIDAKTIENLLQFMYSGSINELYWDIATRLYYAADKYEVLSLKKECTIFLKSNIDTWNLCEVLVMADRHQDAELKSSAYKFLLKHKDQSVRSREWKAFMKEHAELAVETMHLILLNKDVLYK